MRNKEAKYLLERAIAESVARPLLGSTLAPTSALFLRGLRAGNIFRLPIEANTAELQNAQGQFFWLDGWSHPNGGDLR